MLLKVSTVQSWSLYLTCLINQTKTLIWSKNNIAKQTSDICETDILAEYPFHLVDTGTAKIDKKEENIGVDENNTSPRDKIN